MQDARLRRARGRSSSRSAGASTATPNQIAEYVDWANVPAARTAQRYGGGRYSPNGFVGRVPV